jgi:hypothetical protein
MNKTDIEEAVKVAEEFIARTKPVLAEMNPKYPWVSCGTAASGALRRQSMELTRALVKLRRSQC